MLPRRVLGGLVASRAEGVDGTCRALVSLQNALCKPSDTGTTQISSPWQQHQTRGQKAAPTPASELPLQTGRARMVVLGTGWAAARLIRDINPKLFDFTVIAHFVRES